MSEVYKVKLQKPDRTLVFYLNSRSLVEAFGEAAARANEGELVSIAKVPGRVKTRVVLRMVRQEGETCEE